MKKKTALVIGILGIMLVFGAAIALAQKGSQKTEDTENHECTPEMMENMSENCPERMMQSGACENMMKETDHCGDMDSEMGSMMVSSGVGMGSMM